MILRGIILLGLIAAAPAGAQTLDVLPAQGNVYMIAGPGGNTSVQIGSEAIILVDTQTADVSDALLAAIEALSPKPIRHIVLTSADPDHTGGAAALSRAGTYVRLLDAFDPRGLSANAAIVGHINVLLRMSVPDDGSAPADSAAWPTDTYFTDGWEFYVNGEAIRLLHVPAAHSDGDTIVFFRRSDVVSTGDIYNTDRYPEFEAGRGGIAGIIEGLNLILDLTIPGDNQTGGTVVIPGHGRLSDETEVANYRDMVTIVRDRIQSLIDQGLSLDQVQAARPTRDYDGVYTGASGARTADEFVAAIYADLSGGGQ